jgi:hypothetical protein
MGDGMQGVGQRQLNPWDTTWWVPRTAQTAPAFVGRPLVESRTANVMARKRTATMRVG